MQNAQADASMQDSAGGTQANTLDTQDNAPPVQVSEMEIDQQSSNFSQPSTPAATPNTVPHFGTVRQCELHPPKLEKFTTVRDLFEEYKRYSLLYKKDSMASNQEAGTPSYLVSCAWLKAYLRYILHDQFKMEVTEQNLQIDDDHYEANYPGPISNERDLLE